MTLASFNDWLNNYLNFEKTQTKGIFWLDSMRFLCEKLGNPQDKIPCIHVAGSKGKGSVSVMIGSVIEKAGFKCGIYTSPHITDFRERICTPHGFFEDEVYEKSADELTQLVDSIPTAELPGSRPLTWFELVTVFAFLCYKNAGCDYVVYEVGLGGRLDSTNVVKPLVSVLMPIELEHTEFLGDTIEKIAFEKAGIIKDGTPAVVSNQNYDDALAVFKKVAKEKNAPLTYSDDVASDLVYKVGTETERADSHEASCEASTETGREKPNGTTSSHSRLPQQNLTFTLFGKENYSTRLRLFGKVQAQNAVTAALAIRTALPSITKAQTEEGLSEAFLPGRFEIAEDEGRTIILDGAHTVKSISNTLDTMKEMFPNKNYKLLFACAGDKDIKDIIPLFEGKFSSVVFTEPKTVRHCDAEKTYTIATELDIASSVQKDLKKAYQNLKQSAKNDDILLVTGSFYLVSEVKEILNNRL